MAKTTTTQKEPVRLREKKLSNGNVSLYLDICRNGRRHKEYLKMPKLRWNANRTVKRWLQHKPSSPNV